uniref:Uncharacterized protein n=1 Tax=Salix viminalis TaxID=40686 RepID=A0A6N2MV51_SALVM
MMRLLCTLRTSRNNGKNLDEIEFLGHLLPHHSWYAVDDASSRCKGTGSLGSPTSALTASASVAERFFPGHLLQSGNKLDNRSDDST